MKVIELTPKQAYDKLQQGNKILFLDVRSSVEYKFVGHAIDSVLLSWMEDPEWRINTRFSQAVFALLVDTHYPLDAEIILIGRAGRLSMEAGELLIKKGFKNVAHITTGFEGDLDANKHRGNINGWCYDGLPWEQC